MCGVVDLELVAREGSGITVRIRIWIEVKGGGGISLVSIPQEHYIYSLIKIN
jgi:hypothetical protein